MIYGTLELVPQSGMICFSMEHSQLLINSSRLDQGQHSWKQVAYKKLPACQHHVRKHCPVCRSPSQAQVLWARLYSTQHHTSVYA